MASVHLTNYSCERCNVMIVCNYCGTQKKRGILLVIYPPIIRPSLFTRISTGTTRDGQQSSWKSDSDINVNSEQHRANDQNRQCRRWTVVTSRGVTAAISSSMRWNDGVIPATFRLSSTPQGVGVTDDWRVLHGANVKHVVRVAAKFNA